ncbi:MAG: RNA 2',3'-cyclic phosphodiesterase [Chloroflexota bacterium]
MEQLRCFVAIELEEAIHQEIHRTQALLRNDPAGRYGRWVRPEGIHLTLKFLGDVPADQIDAITQAIRDAAEGVAPFRVSFGGLGCFPNTRFPRVIWIGVEDPGGTLLQLQQAVEANLSALGYPPERRAFHPHLTLARTRRVSKGEQTALGKLVERSQVNRPGDMLVREISLMRSELRSSGAVYTQLAAAHLHAKE